jgi:16S rRNA (adenine1518-N6/adenine1519-N6)-dimethyltransferase
MNADNLPTLRAELEAHDLWANKNLGQHFLLDMNITRRIARLAGDLTGKAIIEVGPGPGGLTRALLEAGADPLIVIEKDERFLPLLTPLEAWSGGRLVIVAGDATKLRFQDLLAAHFGKTDIGAANRSAPAAAPAGLEAGTGPSAGIVSNLPYNIGTTLLVSWLKAEWRRDDMTLMFQKEVADRIVAKPGDEAYGRLAVLSQARCRVRRDFIVPARAFTPPPKIDSALVSFSNRADAYPRLDALERVTAAAFGQRRKMLRSALRALAREPEPLLRAANIEPTARAEQIDQAGFRRLADAWLKVAETPAA